MDDFKYLVAFPIPKLYRSKLCHLMDEVAVYTKITPPYKEMEIHMTFQSPMIGIEQKAIENIIQTSVDSVKQTTMAVGNLFPFGENYIVLPVYTTFDLALLWCTLYTRLSELPGYVHGEYYRKNILHITIAKKVSKVFDKTWRKIKIIPVPNLVILVDSVSLYRKRIDGVNNKWEKVKTFNILT